MVIFLKCGATVAIISANEGTTCSYSIVLQTPKACIDNTQGRYGLTYTYQDTFTSSTNPTTAQCARWQQYLVRPRPRANNRARRRLPCPPLAPEPPRATTTGDDPPLLR